MPTPSMTLISTQTVGAGGATFLEFTNIPQTFTDLQVVLSARTGPGTASDSLQVQFNSSTTGYTVKSLFNISGNVYSASNLTNSIFSNGGDSTANTFGNTNIYIPNYTAVATKSWSVESVCEQNLSTGVWLNMSANTWATAAAVTSLKIISLNNFAFQQGTIVSLYGITKYTVAPFTAKATGGTVTADANYIYHTFTGSGTFAPTQALTADVLIVAGGGGASGYGSSSGGAGAGGVVYSAGNSLTVSNYSVVVGAGGAGNSAYQKGINGSNSTFGALTAAVGGGGAGAGGDNANYYGNSGGSGGGSAGNSWGYTTNGGGAGTAGQGYAGGDGKYYNSSNRNGGGGGGAGGVGGTSTDANNVARGGLATYAYASWAFATNTGVAGGFAGGGGAVSGAANVQYGKGGGGGAGDAYNAASNVGQGIANTGGGAGATWSDGNGPSGGSGLVIVRYAR